MKYDICIVTSTRAEYGLLKPLIQKINKDQELNLKLIVTGMHLSVEYGNTVNYIEKDGYHIDDKIEILLSSDSAVGVAKSMGLAMISFAESLNKLNPDLLIVLGDRSEIFAISSVATVLNIPIAHISGGDVTEGAYDDAFRHSISKMSYLHFATTDIYRNRVIQLGENPNRVFNLGNLGVENILNINLLSKKELLEFCNVKTNLEVVTVLFHPQTLDNKKPREQLEELLNALKEFSNFHYLIIKGNSDNGGRELNKLLDEFVIKNQENYSIFTSLDTKTYLSLLKHSKFIIGNSSSGITEAPSFKIPTINLGDRQKGRIRAESVIDCDLIKEKIVDTINKVISKEFQNVVDKVNNPYGNGCTSEKMVEIIKEFLNNKKIDLKKKFYDIEFGV